MPWITCILVNKKPFQNLWFWWLPFLEHLLLYKSFIIHCTSLKCPNIIYDSQCAFGITWGLFCNHKKNRNCLIMELLVLCCCEGQMFLFHLHTHSSEDIYSFHPWPNALQSFFIVAPNLNSTLFHPTNLYILMTVRYLGWPSCSRNFSLFLYYTCSFLVTVPLSKQMLDS